MRSTVMEDVWDHVLRGKPNRKRTAMERYTNLCGKLEGLTYQDLPSTTVAEPSSVNAWLFHRAISPRTRKKHLSVMAKALNLCVV